MNIGDTALTDKIEKALDGIRPYLNADGGDVEFVGIDNDMVVSLRLIGSCRSCDISHLTMKAGIENTLRTALPQIKSVVAVDQ
jgi:Fe-S cluster biogenesis protein NfuA